jgi:hypothetical protein
VANYRVSTNTKDSKKTIQGQNKQTKIKNKSLQSRLLIFEREFLKKICTFTTVFAAENYRAVGYLLKEQLNMLKLRLFRVGTRMPTASRAEWPHSLPLKTFYKTNQKFVM